MVGCWHGYLSGMRCRFAYGPADAIAIHYLLLQEIQIGFGFTFLVPAHQVVPDKIQSSSRKPVVVVHTHNRFVALLDFLQNYPGELAPER